MTWCGWGDLEIEEASFKLVCVSPFKAEGDDAAA